MRPNNSMKTRRPDPVSPREVPVPARPAPMPAWLSAPLTLLGGVAFAGIVFLFLAALQPSDPDSEKFELAPVFKAQVQQAPPPPPAPPPSEQKPKPRKPKPQKKPPKRQPRKVVQKTIAKPQPRQQVARAVSSPSLGNLSVLGAGSGGGVSLDVDINSAFEVASAELQEFQDYEQAQRDLAENADAARNQLNRGSRAGGASQARDARVQTAPKPPYPPKARQAGKEGTVYARLFISVDGTVENHEVDYVDPDGFGFEDAFVATLPRWRFTAAKDEEGRPTGQWIDWQYQFKLNDR